MKDKYVVAATGIVAVAVIECFNLYTKGPDQTIVSAVIGAITLIVGWVLGKKVS